MDKANNVRVARDSFCTDQRLDWDLSENLGLTPGRGRVWSGHWNPTFKRTERALRLKLKAALMSPEVEKYVKWYAQHYELYLGWKQKGRGGVGVLILREWRYQAV